MNLSNHKFRFEAYQLPSEFKIDQKLIKETLNKIDKIDKDKIIHEYRSIKVYSNHQVSNEESNNHHTGKRTTNSNINTNHKG